jgi:hypothetical protein
MLKATVLTTGKPVVAYDDELDRYPFPDFRRFVELGFKSSCCVPLITNNRTLGELAFARITAERQMKSTSLHRLYPDSHKPPKTHSPGTSFPR